MPLLLLSCRPVTIFLVIPHQLERIDQVVTKPQRCRMHFVHLRFIGINTDLNHQYPVRRSSFVLASRSRTSPVALLLPVFAVSVSRRYPPNVVIQRETVSAPRSPCFFSGFPAQHPNDRYHPLPPSPKLPESFQRYIHRAFLPSCVLPQKPHNCHTSLRCRHGALSGDRNLYAHFF